MPLRVFNAPRRLIAKSKFHVWLLDSPLGKESVSRPVEKSVQEPNSSIQIPRMPIVQHIDCKIIIAVCGGVGGERLCTSTNAKKKIKKGRNRKYEDKLTLFCPIFCRLAAGLSWMAPVGRLSYQPSSEQLQTWLAVRWQYTFRETFGPPASIQTRWISSARSTARSGVTWMLQLKKFFIKKQWEKWVGKKKKEKKKHTHDSRFRQIITHVPSQPSLFLWLVLATVPNRHWIGSVHGQQSL